MVPSIKKSLKVFDQIDNPVQDILIRNISKFFFASICFLNTPGQPVTGNNATGSLAQADPVTGFHSFWRMIKEDDLLLVNTFKCLAAFQIVKTPVRDYQYPGKNIFIFRLGKKCCILPY
jgi:hypothetical protein